MNSAFAFTGGAEFSFLDRSVKFPDTQEGVLLEHDFEFQNTGDEPLVINSYEVACSCTKIDFPKEPIAPGKKGQIHLSFDTNAKYGFQSRKVKISSNAKKEITVIQFKVTVIPHNE
jgi:outer membrane biosynthesis protein TonB